MQIYAVLTGDLIRSRQSNSKQWIPVLKKILEAYGARPKYWDIFRGDSFQVLLKPALALDAALKIKTSIKQFKNLDVRIAIGLGKVNYHSKHITESNGPAFINSGDLFDILNKHSLAIKSPWSDFDHSLNIMLQLADLAMERWTPNQARIILLKLENPKINQADIAKKLKKSGQGLISDALKRTGFDEIQKIVYFYAEKLKKLC